MNAHKKLTVLHFSNEPVRGGAEEHLLMLLSRLDREKFRPLLAAPQGLVDLFGADLPPDVGVIPLDLRSFRDVAGAWRLARTLARTPVDILHSHMFQASKFASPLGWLTRVPVIVETTHVREHWRKGAIKGSYFVDRLIGRCVTSFIAVSGANGDYLRSEKRLPAHKVNVIRNGVPVRRFDPARRPPPELRRSLDIGEDCPVAVVLARLEPQKGHAVLLDAWKTVAAGFPAARLVCVGDGSLRASLEAKASALGISSTIRFAGYQSNTPDWLALADFTILPSFYEGLPLVAIESLAAGRPVVATAVDGTTEVILDGRTGYTVPAGEPEALAGAICRMFRSPEDARRMGAAGRLMAEEMFDQQRQVTETEQLYLNATRRRTGSRSPLGMPQPLAARDSK